MAIVESLVSAEQNLRLPTELVAIFEVACFTHRHIKHHPLLIHSSKDISAILRSAESTD